MNAIAIDIDTIKARMKAGWMAGDFGQIARSYEAGAAEFVRELKIAPGARLLDVACGTGNTAIPAAHAGAVVTGVDIAPNLIEQARWRAGAEGLKIQLDEGDAEQLPYGDGDFDIVLTMFGAMFAPRPERAAAELIRVCKPGGRIVMANWTPDCFITQMYKITGKYVAPPGGLPAPAMWGDETIVRERLNGGIADLRLTHHNMHFYFPFSPTEVAGLFLTYLGPTQRAFDGLDSGGKAAFRSDLEQLWAGHNRAGNNETQVESEYLKVDAIRR